MRVILGTFPWQVTLSDCVKDCHLLNETMIVQILRRLTHDPLDLEAMRSLMARLAPMSTGERPGDEQVVQQLAMQVRRRQLCMRLLEPERPQLKGGKSAPYQPTPEPLYQPRPVRAAPRPVAEPAPHEELDVDQDRQAAALVEASREGIPFCEECERARREREGASA